MDAFERGLAALHNFEYEEANAAFLEAQRLDAGLALAYWGEALSYHQTLWGQEDVAAGRRALGRLDAAAAARAALAASARTRALVEAAQRLFAEGDRSARRAEYKDAMAALYAAHADDPDVASLYALALLGTMSRSLIGSHEGHSTGLAGSAVQRQVGELLDEVLRAHPEHPGALHYLIHNYDDPAHARLALDASRTYAKVAPESSHAQHMPAHIFLQLGLWAEAETSDRAAYAASEAWVARRGLPPAMRNYHALAWRQYELLQLGRVREADALIGELAPVVQATGDLRLLSDLASMRARQVVESRQWDRMANERNFANVNELCAIGFAAARSGNAGLAELARQGLAQRATRPEEGDLRPAIAIMEREVAAVIALMGGRHQEAVDLLQVATRDELALPPPLGLPIPLIPAPELLGETLLELGRPAEARAAFDQALARNANRTRSVLGLARAATRLGDADAARTHYARVLDNYSGADAALPEIAEARAALASPAGSTVPARLVTARWPAIAAVIVGIGLLLLAIRWRMPRPRVSAAAATPPPRSESRKRHKSGRK
jgi:tetratricopeptide (TPR) repeat protein